MSAPSNMRLSREHQFIIAILYKSVFQMLSDYYCYYIPKLRAKILIPICKSKIPKRLNGHFSPQPITFSVSPHKGIAKIKWEEIPYTAKLVK